MQFILERIIFFIYKMVFNFLGLNSIVYSCPWQTDERQYHSDQEALCRGE